MSENEFLTNQGLDQNIENRNYVPAGRFAMPQIGQEYIDHMSQELEGINAILAEYSNPTHYYTFEEIGDGIKNAFDEKLISLTGEELASRKEILERALEGIKTTEAYRNLEQGKAVPKNLMLALRGLFIRYVIPNLTHDETNELIDAVIISENKKIIQDKDGNVIDVVPQQNVLIFPRFIKREIAPALEADSGVITEEAEAPSPEITEAQEEEEVKSPKRQSPRYPGSFPQFMFEVLTESVNNRLNTTNTLFLGIPQMALINEVVNSYSGNVSDKTKENYARFALPEVIKLGEHLGIVCRKIQIKGKGNRNIIVIESPKLIETGILDRAWYQYKLILDQLGGGELDRLIQFGKNNQKQLVTVEKLEKLETNSEQYDVDLIKLMRTRADRLSYFLKEIAKPANESNDYDSLENAIQDLRPYFDKLSPLLNLSEEDLELVINLMLTYNGALGCDVNTSTEDLLRAREVVDKIEYRKRNGNRR